MRWSRFPRSLASLCLAAFLELAPQACAPGARFAFLEFVGVPLLDWLLTGVSLRPSGHAGCELCPADIEGMATAWAVDRLYPYSTDDAPVMIAVGPMDGCRLAVGQIREVLPGMLAERLLASRCIDPAEPDQLLPVIDRQAHERVAARHACDTAFELGRKGGGAEKEQGEADAG